LLTVVDVKLARLKFAILFRIADVCWVKKQDRCTLLEDTKK